MDDLNFDLRSIFGLLRRQYRLIIITVIVVVGAAALVAFSMTPIYTSSALILVDPSNKNLLSPESQLSSASADSARIDSEVELVRSDNVLLRVIQSENLVSDSEFGVSLGVWQQLSAFLRISQPTLPTAEQALNQALGTLRNMVSVQRRAATYLISVQVRSEEPAKAAALANALTSAYIADQLASKVNSMLASRDILQSRITQARDAIVRSEGSFDTFISNNIAEITQDPSNTSIGGMQQQLQELLDARDRTSAVVDSVQSSLATGDWQSIVTNLQSDALAELQTQREALLKDLSSTASGTPVELNLREELTQLDSRLRQTATSEVGALRESLQQTQDREQELRQTIRREVLNSNLSADVLAQLYELQQSAELARTQYQTLLARAQEVEAQASLQLPDSRIVSPALAPESPSFPNKQLIVLLAGLVALGLGLALAFLYENLIGGFTSEGQVEAVLRTDVAATIPREKGRAEKESLANVVVSSPLSIFAESIRRLRTSIQNALRPLHRGAESSSSVIMVTSTAPNEGKTTLALSLARSYAMFGQRCLLIDCDLRKPSIHRHLNLQPSSGLIDFLNAEIDTIQLSEILIADELTSVTCIIGARRSDIPTDQLLAGKEFERLITSARKSFDIVILDTPPVGPVVDGLYLAHLVDIIVFVARWATTSQLDAKRSVASLAAAKMPETPIITVLNQQDAARTSYGSKYGGYYSYNS